MPFMVNGVKMKISYDDKYDLLYIRFSDDSEVINQRITEDIVLDIGANEKIIGLEILNASKHINMASVLPIEYASSK